MAQKTFDIGMDAMKNQRTNDSAAMNGAAMTMQKKTQIKYGKIGFVRCAGGGNNCDFSFTGS